MINQENIIKIENKEERIEKVNKLHIKYTLFNLINFKNENTTKDSITSKCNIFQSNAFKEMIWENINLNYFFEIGCNSFSIDDELYCLNKSSENIDIDISNFIFEKFDVLTKSYKTLSQKYEGPRFRITNV